MLSKIVDSLKNSINHIEDGTYFCENYILNDISIVEYFESENILENTLSSKEIGNKVNLELTLARLNSIGYYQNSNTLILKNKYQKPNGLFYVEELKCYSNEPNEFFDKYTNTINLISAIERIAKHTYLEVDIKKSIVSKEEKTIFIPLDYDANLINKISKDGNENLKEFTNEITKTTSEKTLLFVNEFIDYLIQINENNRFKDLLLNITEFHQKCNSAYQFYLSNFSHNKLKLELDSKALEYTQKIQTVINDAQVKLIAIPTAFVLVVGTFDFSDLSSIKNIVSIISLFIFSVLIQLFINNQKSTLNFIWQNILTYKESFKGNNIESISSKFSLVEDELKIQKGRILIVEIILWFIPVSLLLFLIWNWKVNLAIYCVIILIIVIDYIITNFD